MDPTLSSDSAGSERVEYGSIEPGWIRVLHILPESTRESIRCQLQALELVDRDELKTLRPESAYQVLPLEKQYAALSYCWGDQTLVADVTVDGKLFSVAKSLFDFLQQAVESPKSARTDFYFWRGPWWVDAICIDQANVVEKSAQVNEMWRIYSQAHISYIWLGAGDQHTDLALDAMNAFYHAQFEDVDVNQAESQRTLDELMLTRWAEVKLAVINVSLNPYWSRVWIVQELAWSKYTALMCGSRTAALPSLQLFDEECLRIENGIHKGQSQLSADCYTLFLQCHEQSFEASPKNALNARSQVWISLSTNISRNCSDPRDRVFGALSLPNMLELDPSCRFKADYSMTIEETGIAVMAWLDDVARRNTEPDLFEMCLSKDLVFPLLPDCKDTELRSSLRRRAYWDERQHIWLLRTASSGREIDCSGESLHHLIHHDSKAKACGDTHCNECNSTDCKLCQSERDGTQES